MEFRCFLIYKLRYRTLHMHFRLMAAIFDLPVTLTSESIHNSPTVLLDPENVEEAVGISLLYFYKLRYTTLHMYFRLMAAIFDLPITPTSESRRVSTIVSPCCWIPKTTRLPLEFRCRQLFKICTSSYMCFRYHIRHFDFGFNTVGF